MITSDITAEETEAQRHKVPCQDSSMNNRKKLILNEHSVPKEGITEAFYRVCIIMSDVGRTHTHTHTQWEHYFILSNLANFSVYQ